MPGPVPPLDGGSDEPDPSPPVRLAAVEVALEGLRAHLGAEAERAAARERVIDRQHEEVERLRSELRANPLRPTAVDLARLRNDLLRQAATAPAGMTVEDTTKLLRSFADLVEETLERCGVTVLPPTTTGSAFVPGAHQVAGGVGTDDSALDGTVAETVQDGYAEIDGRAIVPARVKLYRYSGTEERTDD